MVTYKFGSLKKCILHLYTYTLAAYNVHVLYTHSQSTIQSHYYCITSKNITAKRRRYEGPSKTNNLQTSKQDGM